MMSTPKHQLTLGPMALEKVSGATESVSNSVADDPIDVCFVLDRAFRAEGFTAQLAAGSLGMSPASYSKAIGSQYGDNPVMKRLGLPENRKPLKRFWLLLGEALEMSAPDSEHVRVLREFSRVLKAVGE